MNKTHFKGKELKCLRRLISPSLPAFCIAFLSFGAISIQAENSDHQAFEDSDKKTVLSQGQEFDRMDLVAPNLRSSGTTTSFSFLSPNRFSMSQSYSVGFSSSSYGSSSAGLYLNTLNYQLSEPLTLSADVGFFSPLYSSSPGSFNSRGLQDPTKGSSFVFPRIGLEYKPTKNLSFSLQLLNGQDANKAYGTPSPFLNPWLR